MQNAFKTYSFTDYFCKKCMLAKLIRWHRNAKYIIEWHLYDTAGLHLVPWQPNRKSLVVLGDFFFFLDEKKLGICPLYFRLLSYIWHVRSHKYFLTAFGLISVSIFITLSKNMSMWAIYNSFCLCNVVIQNIYWRM